MQFYFDNFKQMLLKHCVKCVIYLLVTDLYTGLWISSSLYVWCPEYVFAYYVWCPADFSRSLRRSAGIRSLVTILHIQPLQTSSSHVYS